MTSSDIAAGGFDYPAFLGDAWCWALRGHIEALIAGDGFYPSEVRVSLPENGHAIAAVAISVAILESYARLYAGRELGLDTNEKGMSGTGEAVVRRLLERAAKIEQATGTIRQQPRLADELIEVFQIRNAVAHGHAWMVTRGRFDTDARMGVNQDTFERIVGTQPAANSTELLDLPRNGVWHGKEHVLKVLDRCLTAIRIFELAWGAGSGIDKQLVHFPAARRSIPLSAAVERLSVSVRATGSRPSAS